MNKEKGWQEFGNLPAFVCSRPRSLTGYSDPSQPDSVTLMLSRSLDSLPLLSVTVTVTKYVP